jgi:ribA/ribD-fused uncharacterized protein
MAAIKKMFSPYKVKLRSANLDKTIDDHCTETEENRSIVINDTECDELFENVSATERMFNIEKMLKTLVPTVNQIQADIGDIKTGQSEQINAITHRVSILENDLQQVKAENFQLKSEFQNLNDRMNKLECYSRRNNLLLLNVPEDQAPLSTTLCKILNKMGIPDPESIVIDDIHRIGAPGRSRTRPIIFRLLHRPEWLRIWNAKTNLKGTPYILSEHLPDEYQRDRSLLRPVFTAAKSQGKKASFVGNKLKVDGRLYGVSDVNTLPANLNPEQSCIKQNSDLICFFGRYTPFSNFYRCDITVEGHKYNCVEQYLQHKKAANMGDDIIAQKVLTLADPATQKYEGKKAKGQTQLWTSVAKVTVHKAVFAKFQQHPKLLEYLMATNNKILAEASKDTDWGIGSTLNDPHSLNTGSWQGKNWLGEILVQVRQELQST